MAILQLSKITNRKGLATDLPQLAGAELGWALDDRKLYIGNGTIVDGAPVIGNTEILTEFSDILAMSSTYTYKGAAAGYVVKTGANDEQIVRSLQSKFDEFVSVKDFGAIGDGLTDDTDAINRALYELFCRQTNTEVRRSLYFPAGDYLVSKTIKVPPHAKLWGEGLTSSIIKFVSGPPVYVSALTVGERYAISDLGNTTNPQWVTAGVVGTAAVNDVFIAVASTIGSGTVRSVDLDVVETADSLQQTGINMGSGAELPTGIEMSSMGIYTEEENTLLKLDSVSNSVFSYLGLHGVSDPLTPGYETAAISIATSVSPTQDITINKLDTQGSTYALRVEGEARGVVLENSGLDLHFKGVLITNTLISAPALVVGTEYKIMDLGDTDFTSIGAEFNRVGVVFTATGSAAGTTGKVISMADPGPTGVVVSRNIFDNIAREGIEFNNVLFNSSGYNVFYNVGNDLGSNAISPVITMATDQCVSVGDLFERRDETLQPRVSLTGNGGIYLDGAHSIHLGSYERQVGLAAELAAGTNGVLVNTIASLPTSYKVDYTIANTTNTRMGSITVSVYNGVVSFSDDFTESGSLNVLLEAVPGPNSDSTLEYTSSGGTATINFSIVRLD